MNFSSVKLNKHYNFYYSILHNYNILLHIYTLMRTIYTIFLSKKATAIDFFRTICYNINNKKTGASHA